MYLRRDEVEPERRTSPLALRISIITGIAIAIFSVLFLRLWYVQVLSGDKYRNQANDNRIREIRVQAPRGRHPRPKRQGPGRNRTELAIQVTPQDLPPPGPEPLTRAEAARHRHRHDHEGDPQGARGRRAAPRPAAR